MVFNCSCTIVHVLGSCVLQIKSSDKTAQYKCTNDPFFGTDRENTINKSQLEEWIVGEEVRHDERSLKRKRQLCEKSTARGGVGTRLHCVSH